LFGVKAFFFSCQLQTRQPGDVTHFLDCQGHGKGIIAEGMFAGVPCPYGTVWKANTRFPANNHSILQGGSYKASQHIQKYVRRHSMAAELL
jgi:hypothetical protein